MTFDRFDEWNEDWLREEMEAEAPSLGSIYAPEWADRVDRIVAATSRFTPRSAKEIASRIGIHRDQVQAALPGLKAKGLIAVHRLDNGRKLYSRA